MGTAGGTKTTSEARKMSFFHVRNWHGMPLGVWLRALRANHFAVPASCALQALRMTGFACANTLLHWADRFIYDRPVARARTRGPRCSSSATGAPAPPCSTN